MFFAKFNPSLVIKKIESVKYYLIVLNILLYVVSLYFIFNSPIDYQQGIYVKIMYVHVPSAWMSLLIYSFMGFCGIICLVYRSIFSFILAKASCTIGACFTIITIITGSLWGKPIWGDWWVWDARLTSMLVLLIFYLAFIIVSSSENLYKIEKPASVIAILGLINIPIVKFSVNLWYSLHQPASVIRSGGPSIDNSMLIPLIMMFASSFLFFIILLTLKTRYIIEQHKLK